MPRSTKYPTPVRTRSGCKVGWYVYADRGDAEQASAAAKEDAARMAGLGYDFGYSSPGEIQDTADGMFMVTVP